MQITGTTVCKQLILGLKPVKTGSVPSLQLQGCSTADMPCWKMQGEPQVHWPPLLKRQTKPLLNQQPQKRNNKTLPCVQLMMLHLLLNSWLPDAQGHTSDVISRRTAPKTVSGTS